jgi:predicted transcriptional regulator
MVVNLSPDQEAQLEHIAVQSGQGADALAQKVLERYLVYEAAEAEALDQGLAQADRGELIDHETVVVRFEKY